MSAALETLREAAEGRERGRAEFYAAVLAARAEGHSQTEIARAAGITKAGVRWILKREERKT